MVEETGETVRVSVERINGSTRDAAVRTEVAATLEAGKRDDTLEPCAIRAGTEVVGFFGLDFDRDERLKYTGAGSRCGLRGCLIGCCYKERATASPPSAA